MSRVLLPAAFLLAASPALGGQEVVDGRTVYEAAFFQPFAPQTARDMVRRMPGFRLEDIDTEVRGFGGAAGNVVINGRRPSAKSERLETILSRIPAARVTRIEVGPGEGFGAEFVGRPQVANIVLDGSLGLSGTVEAEVRRSFRGDVKPYGQAAVTKRQGDFRINLAAGAGDRALPEVGTDRVVAADGTILEERTRLNRFRDPTRFAAVTLAHEGGADRSATLNARLDSLRFRFTQKTGILPGPGPARQDVLEQQADGNRWEVGGDLTRPLGGGAMKLIVLARRDPFVEETLLRLGVDGSGQGGFRQTIAADRRETVARLRWARPALSGFSVEMGGEMALNRLDNDTGLAALLPGGGEVPVALPIASVVVREVRGELFANAGRALAPGLRLDAGLTVEGSRLTLSGDADARRVLWFPKPKLAFDWRRGGWRHGLSVTRTVNQLDFRDFASAAELTNDRVNAGNADLEPQRSWELLATTERSVLGDGVVRLEGGVNLVSRVQDRVRTADGFDAPGNLGAGRALIARANIDLPLARLGIAGGRVNGRLSLVETRVTDPLTGRARRFSGNAPLVAELGFRQDRARFAWGATLFYNSENVTFRVAEEDRFFRDNPRLQTFIEARPDPSTTVAFTVMNLTDRSFFRERRFFVPDRSAADPVLVEKRVRTQHVIPMLAVKRQFG